MKTCDMPGRGIGSIADLTKAILATSKFVRATGKGKSFAHTIRYKEVRIANLNVFPYARA